MDEVDPDTTTLQSQASQQLYRDLHTSVAHSLSQRRPILHHLNADTSWLLQLPRPLHAVQHGSRNFYNVLIDPWLSGGQSDVAKWFSQQFHAEESAVRSIQEIEELVRRVEKLVAGTPIWQGAKREAENSGHDSIDEHGDMDVEEESWIDCLAISHEFTDHCHKDTLLTLHPDVPVLAVAPAAKLIRGWNHFRTVLTMPIFNSTDIGEDWHTTSILPLPDWLGISRLTSKGDALNYHSAVMICFDTCFAPRPVSNQNGTTQKQKRHTTSSDDTGSEGAAEALLYTPHGFSASSLPAFAVSEPPIVPLAFLHGLHDIRIGSAQPLNLGAHNALKAQRVLKAKYWIGTHDEVKTGGGLVSWFLRRKVVGVGEAVELERSLKGEGEVVGGHWAEEAEREGEGGRGLRDLKNEVGGLEGTGWVEVGNGVSKVLT